ncbi:MAG: hypothetical protein KF910_04210 [Brevundimonas sp.]|uniref:hypothetical protein n=1 Tax=Brevundimonas sp. TaxID=1871086 RepID=UPI0025BCBDE7|nr:hypothetical protein [Brevundimonas sp.]MBX3476785.1 hypothetical protein [Brevundimonas sp.]
MRTMIGAGAALTVGVLVLAAPDAVQAQFHGGRAWGQPAYGADIQPSPLSEARARAHARLGAAGDGYAHGEGPLIHRPHGYDHGNRHRWGRGSGYGGRYAAGYRDEWGYADDRPPSRWRSWPRGDAPRYGWSGRDGPDVYLYDR